MGSIFSKFPIYQTTDDTLLLLALFTLMTGVVVIAPALGNPSTCPGPRVGNMIYDQSLPRTVRGDRERS